MKFPWVLVFDLGISNFKIVAHNFAEFPGVKNLFSRISKGNVTNLKFPEGAFQQLELLQKKFQTGGRVQDLKFLGEYIEKLCCGNSRG